VSAARAEMIHFPVKTQPSEMETAWIELDELALEIGAHRPIELSAKEAEAEERE
jgi:hypothetical protein